MSPSDDRRPVSLRRRLGLLALVFLTLVLVAAGLSALMVRSWNRAVEQRSDARLTADQVSELQLAYSDQETGIRGYALSGDPEFLEPYDDGVAVGKRADVRLTELLSDDPTAAAQLTSVREAGVAWRTAVALPRIRGGENAPDVETARAAFDEVRAELERLDRLVADDLATIVARADRVGRMTVGVLVASAALATVGTGFVIFLFRSWVIEPLERISRSARAIGSGHDEVALPDFDSPELQDVTTAIRELQVSLETARDEAITAYDALEQSAVLALKVRAELANELGSLPAGWSASSLLVPAEGVVAGDCYDLGLLDAHHLYLVLVDVTGHGAAAALDALQAKAQLRAALRSRLSPGAAIEWLAREHDRDEHPDLLTAIVMVIDTESGVCEYANAGHPPALLTDGRDHAELAATGPLVGAFRTAWTTETVVIPTGSTLLVHSDGITEAVGDERERFGEERLRGCLVDTIEPGPLIEQLHDAVESFRVGPRSDDVTAIAIRRQVVGDPDPVHPRADTVLP